MNCPRDTDGDGNCGQPHCPHCRPATAPNEAVAPYWWLSFSDLSKPKGQRCIGACIVQAANLAGAVLRAWRLGINPGGEVQGCRRDELPEILRPHIGKLMSRAEWEKITKMSDWK